jgi:hypothetical protein
MSNTKLFKNSYFKLPKVHHSQLYHFSFKTHNYFDYIESFPAQLEGNYAEALQNYYEAMDWKLIPLIEVIYFIT